MGAARKIKMFLSQSKQVSNKLRKEKGRSRISTFFDLVSCSIKYKTSPHNYEVMGFADLKDEQRKTFFTFSDNIAMMEKYNSKKHEAIFYNKFIFSKVFSDFYGRKCVMTNYLTLEDFEKFMEGENKIVYKPVNAAQGKGVEVLDSSDFENLSKLYDYVKALPKGIIETWIVQHPAISALYPNAVNPIRINTVLENDKLHIMTSTLSIGHNSKIANASINALFALVDPKTGEVLTDACDYDGGVYKNHPETNAQFKGFKIPYWNETLEMLEKATRTMYQVGYVGWDIAITENGPILIEGNNDPGYIGFQLPLFVNGKGTRNLYEKFLTN